MELIIQQIANNLVKETLSYISKNGIKDIGKCSRDFLPMCENTVNEVLKALISQLDKEVINAKKDRKLDGMTIKDRDVERTILLDTGSITYNRTYYQLASGGYIFPVDHMIGVEESSRMSREIEAMLVGNSANMSYGKSSSMVRGGVLSRQTVRNKVLDVAEVVHIPPKSENTPKELHIFADEDHVHMQPERKDGTKKKGDMVHLITASEGVKKVNKGRNELISPIHFEGYKMKPEKQWEYVQAVLTETYEMDKVETVWIHGDGASWIKTGLKTFPNAKPVIDRYHLNKYMMVLTRGPLCYGAGPKLWWAMRKNKINEFSSIINTIIDRIPSYYSDEEEQLAKQKRITGAASYITDNWASIQNRLNEVNVGSCTEPLVSHVLSERLSRNPMGWSKTGLSQMAMIRVYTQNGESISTDNVRSKRDRREVVTSLAKYETLVESQIEAVTTAAKDWDWIHGEPHVYGKTTGTTVLLRSYGRMNDVS